MCVNKLKCRIINHSCEAPADTELIHKATRRAQYFWQDIDSLKKFRKLIHRMMSLLSAFTSSINYVINSYWYGRGEAINFPQTNSIWFYSLRRNAKLTTDRCPRCSSGPTPPSIGVGQNTSPPPLHQPPVYFRGVCGFSSAPRLANN